MNRRGLLQLFAILPSATLSTKEAKKQVVKEINQLPPKVTLNNSIISQEWNLEGDTVSYSFNYDELNKTTLDNYRKIILERYK